MARPTIYTDELAVAICTRIASGESVLSICRDASMPAQATVYDWVLNNQAFSEKYALARRLQAEKLADELFDIADDGQNDWMERNGHETPNGEVVARSRLRVDTRKWYLSKVLPKVYGDKLLDTLPGRSGKVEVSWNDSE